MHPKYATRLESCGRGAVGFQARSGAAETRRKRLGRPVRRWRWESPARPSGHSAVPAMHAQTVRAVPGTATSEWAGASRAAVGWSSRSRSPQSPLPASAEDTVQAWTISSSISRFSRKFRRIGSRMRAPNRWPSSQRRSDRLFDAQMFLALLMVLGKIVSRYSLWKVARRSRANIRSLVVWIEYLMKNWTPM